MPFPAAAAIAAGSSLAGGLLGSSSATQQNREERAWQEKMRATQYQTAVQDMRLAGLNPAMLYGHGGMSANVSGGARQDEGEGIREGVRGVGTAALMQAQVEQMQSASAVSREQAKMLQLDREIKELDFAGESMTPGLKIKPSAIVPGGLDIPPEMSGVRRGQLISKQRVVDILRGQAQIQDLGFSVVAREVQNDLTRITKRLQELGIPEKEAMAALYKEWGSKIAGARGMGEVLNILKMIISLLK